MLLLKMKRALLPSIHFALQIFFILFCHFQRNKCCSKSSLREKKIGGGERGSIWRLNNVFFVSPYHLTLSLFINFHNLLSLLSTRQAGVGRRNRVWEQRNNNSFAEGVPNSFQFPSVSSVLFRSLTHKELWFISDRSLLKFR